MENRFTPFIKLILVWGICNVIWIHICFLPGDGDTPVDEEFPVISYNDDHDHWTDHKLWPSASTNSTQVEASISQPQSPARVTAVSPVSNDEQNTNQTQSLILHVGPQKTGSTSVQLNVIRDKRFRKLLQSDHFQEIVSFEFGSFDNLRKKCLEKGTNGCDYSFYNELRGVYEEAYKNTKTSTETDKLPIYYTLHTNEEWSLLPESNLTFSLLEEIFAPWDDVHIIIFYRPVLDWINSIYLQYRKRFLIRPGSIDRFWKQNYLVGRNEQMLFPQYFRHLLNSDALRDTYATYNFYTHFKAHLEQRQQNINKKTNMHIQIMQMKAPHGIEYEFLCNLPGATKSCNYINEKRTDMKFAKRNDGQIIPINLDLLVIEAWNQNLISIQRHDAVTVLDKKMQELNMTMSDLPLVCITSDEENWIWNRTLIAEQMFGPNSKGTLDNLRRSWSEMSNSQKYCSVNASASLEMDSFRSIFDDCIFQSPNLLNRDLKDDGPNPLWNKLGCTLPEVK